MESIVSLCGVSMKYQSKNGEIEAVSNIDLEVLEGEFISIVGPSGCGKSTLLSMIAGLLPPSRGEIYVAGKKVSSPSPTVGYMFQKDHLFGWRTILQNAMLGLELGAGSKKADQAYVRTLLSTYGLAEFADKYPSQLSGGMRQRAALIRTLATRPKILLLDEAFSALDYQTRLAVSDDIYGIIQREKKTAVMVTHDIAEAISMSDRVVVLSPRPASVKTIFTTSFDHPARSPLVCRKLPEFSAYFNAIWKELDIHV
ncbi:MAG: ABC transporter ATP-binding protein [Christensenellaceae bacterium]|nr:ABC transporter ATP-binding protein [Christensenellaceae bacterium]